MTKTKKNGLLLALAAVFLAAISAALLFMIAPKRSAKADEETSEPLVLSEAEFAEKCTAMGYENIKGKYVIALLTPPANYSTMMGDGLLEFIYDSTYNRYNVKHSYMSGSVVYDIISTDIITYDVDEYIYFRMLDNAVLDAAYTVDGPTLSTLHENPPIYVSDTALLFGDYVDNSGTGTGEQPSNPDENPGETPTDEPTETNTDEKKPFDFGEWIYNAGEDVSAWLGENVGIATTGSTVLVVGAVIIIIMIARRRR